MSKPTKPYERPALEVIHFQPGAPLLEGASDGDAVAPRYEPDWDE